MKPPKIALLGGFMIDENLWIVSFKMSVYQKTFGRPKAF